MRLPRNMKRVIKVLILAIIGVLILAIFLGLKKNSEHKKAEIQVNTNGVKQTVYVSNQEIKKGDVITSDIVQTEDIITDVDFSLFFKQEDVGNVAIVDIKQNTPILKTMAPKQMIEKTAREVSYSCLRFGDELKSGDYVDIRIRFLDGEDYIIASKRKVSTCDVSLQKISLLLSEEEHLMVSSGVVDSSMYTATLYLSKYMDSNLQEASTVTYQPYVDVIEQITSNVNIEEVNNTGLDAQKRIELEKRLYAYQQSYENINNEEATDEVTNGKEQEVPVQEEEISPNTENIIYYYDYTGQGINGVLNSITDASKAQGGVSNTEVINGEGDITNNEQITNEEQNE